MENAAFYVPTDRRQAILNGQPLPERAVGAVLFADISGFTPLTNALVAEFGPRRGADELTRQLNTIYDALITAADRFGGSVINFSGDAITCWFGESEGQERPSKSTLRISDVLKTATVRAVASGLAMQAAMVPFARLELDYGLHVNLAIKTAIVGGAVRRILVGDPELQLIDVLAGTTLDRMAATEQMAQKGEVVLDADTLVHISELVAVHQWRTHTSTGLRYAVIRALHSMVTPTAMNREFLNLPEAQIKPWVLPAVYSRFLSEQGRFLAELRPATALFLRFEGLDYDCDAEAPAKLDVYVRWVQKLVNRYEGSLIQIDHR